MSASRIQVYQYFQTDDIPTESQFQYLFNNIWFKDEQMKVSDISGLEQMFQNTLSVEQLEGHIDDEQAHTQYLATKDGSNIDPEAWKAILEIVRIATVDEGDFEGNVFLKSQVTQMINDVIGNLNDVKQALSSDDINLDELQEIVNYIKENRADIEALQAVIIGETTEDKVNLIDSYSEFGTVLTQQQLNGAFYERLTQSKDRFMRQITGSAQFANELETADVIIQVRDSITGKRMNCDDYATNQTIQINLLDDYENPLNVLIIKGK